MKLETFFEKFELFADAPNAVAKMRELVLEFAVSGRLTAGRVDEPRLSGWRRLPLRDVADYRAASKIDPASIPETAWLLDLEEVEKDSGRILKFCTFHEKASTSTKAAFVAGDVLYGKLRPYLNKVVVAPKAGFCTTEIVPIRSRGSVTPEYLCLFLRSPGFVRYATSKSYGMKMPRLGTADAESAEIPFPPLAEQKRIVEKVDELMALCDRLEAQQQEREEQHAALARASLARFAEAPTLANLEFLFHNDYAISPADLRKSILTLAVQGSLSKSHAGWKECSLKDACLLITDGEHATPERTPSGVPLATAKNVRNGYLDLAVTDFVADHTAEKCWRRCKPQIGDVLMVCVGATTGRVCRLDGPVPEMVLVRSVALLRADPQMLLPAFLDVFLRSPLGQGQVWSGVKQNAQPCLYLSKMSGFEIAIPLLAEQRHIVAKVDELMALVDKLEAELASARTTATNLLAAAVAELTNGKESLGVRGTCVGHSDCLNL